MEIYLYSLFTLGLLLSIYAIHVHRQASKDKNYKSICDLSDKTSCSDTFTSEFGSHFGIPNGYYGMGFYSLMLILLWMESFTILFCLSTISVIASCYLCYLLVTKVRRICIDCIAIYLTNISSFILLWGMM